MFLKDHVEAIIHIFNLEKGNFIVEQNNNEMSKENINHLVILHTNSDLTNKWNEEMIKIDGFNVIPTKPKKKKSKEETEEISDPIANEVEEEDQFSPGESKVSLNKIDELIHIAKSRKINVGNTNLLADDNWYICPIYGNVNGLYPIIYKKLDNKKGYKVYISKIPLISFKENLFTEDNFKEWNCNASFILERYFEKERIYNCSVEGIFVQKRESESLIILKDALKNYEIAQKSRIRCGNIIISRLLYRLGQNEYLTSKENNSKNKSKDGEVDLVKTKNEDTLKEILKCYNKLNKKLKQTKEDKLDFAKTRKKIFKAIQDDDEEKIDSLISDYLDKLSGAKDSKIRLAKTFSTVLELVAEDEKEEAKQIALEYIEKKQDPDMTLEQALKETKVLRTKDYIPNFQTYENITIYRDYCHAENKAEKILKDITRKTWLYEYAQGVRGMGEILTAYILAYIDFHSTIHSSSVFRYLGLDQVIVKAEREPNQVITKKEQDTILKLLFNRYTSITNKSKLTAAMPLTKRTFGTYYKDDVVPTWRHFQLLKEQFTKFNCSTEDDISECLNDILYESSELNEMVNYIWSNMNVIEMNKGNGKKEKVIQKRARDRRYDRPLSTYLDSNGNIKFKSGLGYNSKLKSKLSYLLFECMRRSHNVKYTSIYDNYFNRYTQQSLLNGEDIENKNVAQHNRNKAVRKTMQDFIRELWIYARKYFNLPLNGEGYDDTKIANCNHIHNRGTEDYSNQ